MTQKTFKLPAKRITVNDLLCRSDINEVLEDIEKDKPDMVSLFTIYECKDGSIGWHFNKGMSNLHAIGLLEQVKTWMVSPDDD